MGTEDVGVLSTPMGVDTNNASKVKEEVVLGAEMPDVWGKRGGGMSSVEEYCDELRAERDKWRAHAADVPEVPQ